MKVSICMSTFNRDPEILCRTMESIFSQNVPFNFEVIVCDDGSTTEDAKNICEEFGVKYYRIDRDPIRRNPCIARNVTYRAATGDIIIAQSDEVVHVSPNVIQTIVHELESHPKSFIIASVINHGPDGKPASVYTGKWYISPTRFHERNVPFFFLGALYRRDLYAVGGNDEEFCDYQGYDDDWFATCLTKGLGLNAVYVDTVVGHHLYHPDTATKLKDRIAKDFYAKKVAAAESSGIWKSVGGSWPMSASNLDVIFSEAYKDDGAWAGHESSSGQGSSMEATKSIRKMIPNIINLLEIKSILDIPCGDFHWMSRVRFNKTVTYTGADIVEELILRNSKRFVRHNFCRLDLISSQLPEVDLIFCRDCLVHLSFNDCFKAIENIKRSCKYFMTTTFWNHKNFDIGTSPEWQPRSMTIKPFNFPYPFLVVDELEENPLYADKSLGLWKVSDL